MPERSSVEFENGTTLIELLVVLVIIACIAGAVTFAIANSLQKQYAKECQTNMLMIEAAKDEYARDHPGATSINESEFNGYFRFGIPKCPTHQVYENIYDLNTPVICPVHGPLATNQ
jgi:prepilin-type N-terminal cleavage/methylation domain-containing protein